MASAHALDTPPTDQHGQMKREKRRSRTEGSAWPLFWNSRNVLPSTHHVSGNPKGRIDFGDLFHLRCPDAMAGAPASRFLETSSEGTAAHHRCGVILHVFFHLQTFNASHACIRSFQRLFQKHNAPRPEPPRPLPQIKLQTIFRVNHSSGTGKSRVSPELIFNREYLSILVERSNDTLYLAQGRESPSVLTDANGQHSWFASICCRAVTAN